MGLVDEEQQRIAHQAKYLFGAFRRLFVLSLHDESDAVVALVGGLREIGGDHALIGAGTLAASELLHLELLALPVIPGQEVQVVGGDLFQVTQQVGEKLGAVAPAPGEETLAIQALPLKGLLHPPDRGSDQHGRDGWPLDSQRPAVTAIPSEIDLVVGNQATKDPLALPIDADIPRLRLRTAVVAAADSQPQIGGASVQLGGRSLGGGDTQTAGRGAGAGDDVVSGLRFSEFEGGQPLSHLVERIGGQVGDQQVLLLGATEFPDAEFTGMSGDTPELVDAQLSQRDADGQDEPPRLFLLGDAPQVDRRYRLALVRRGPVAVRCGFALECRPRPGELLPVSLQEALLSKTFHQEFEAGLGAPLAVRVSVVHGEHRLDGGQQLLLPDELLQHDGVTGFVPQTTTRQDLEAGFAFPAGGDDPQVVDDPLGAVLFAAGEAELELARHGLGEGVAQESVQRGPHEGGDVHVFPRADPGQVAFGDVAHGVSARFPGGQSRLAQCAHHLAGVGDRNEVELNVLARSDFGLVVLRIALHDIGDGPQLSRRDLSARQFDAHHVQPRLALSVDPVLQAKGHEAVGIHGAVQEGLQAFFVAGDFVEIDDCGGYGA